MNRELLTVIQQIAGEKGIDKEVLFEALESALLSASKKTMGAADNVRMHLERATGALKVYQRKRVVEEVADPKLEISLAEAKALNPEAELDDELEQELEGIYAEFIGKEGQLVRGIVHRIEKRNVIMEMGKAEAVLPEREQIPGERYNPGDRVRAYVVEVKKSSKGPQITLSRTHPGYLARLFETEIPEVQEGIVVVKAVAREPGERAKVAVASTKRDVDPIGACVGLRGTRIQVISRDLRGEKIDIVEWSYDPATFVARALSPAKVSSVTLLEAPPAAPGEEGQEPPQPAVLVTVPDNQLSLAIGKKGQNARLAAKLTGLRIDIKSESEIEADRVRLEEEMTEGRGALSELLDATPALVDKLVGGGLHSPALVVRAGAERVMELTGMDEKGTGELVAAAQDWLDRHPARPEEEAELAAPADDGGAATE